MGKIIGGRYSRHSNFIASQYVIALVLGSALISGFIGYLIGSSGEEGLKITNDAQMSGASKQAETAEGSLPSESGSGADCGSENQPCCATGLRCVSPFGCQDGLCKRS